MGLNTFRRCSANPASVVAVPPNPSPSRWELIEKIQFAHAYVLKVRYLDCTNFEGVKVMVYKGNYKRRETLDPHFSKDGNSPIARFRPDAEGWSLAIGLAKSL